MQYPLVRLAALIDRAEIERTFMVSFTCGRGRPALSPRLVAGLLYLQHTWKENERVNLCNQHNICHAFRRLHQAKLLVIDNIQYHLIFVEMPVSINPSRPTPSAMIFKIK